MPIFLKKNQDKRLSQVFVEKQSSCNPPHNLYTNTVQVQPSHQRGVFQKEKVIRIQPPITLLFLYFYSQNFTSASIYKLVNFSRENLILSSGSFFDNLSNKKPHIAVGGKSVCTLFLSSGSHIAHSTEYPQNDLIPSGVT